MERKQKEKIGLLPSVIFKTVYLGTILEYNNKRAKVHCSIKYENGKLSISGVVGAKKNGNATGSSGQMYDSILENMENFNFAPEWDKIKAFQFVEYWKEWHLNDMTAGTPKPEAFIKESEKTNKYDYTLACEALKKANLYDDNGYKYGTAWLSKEIPDNVIKFLDGLSEASKPCAWNLTE